MNERIRELALQADIELPNNVVDGINGPGVVSEKDKLAKFAQLIVQECVSILMKPEYAMNHPGELADYNRGWVNGRLLGIEHIEEYFGVEE
jgi:hypothetical protein